MAYRLKLTDEARRSIDDCVFYLMYQVGGLGNIQAANNFIKNLESAFEFIVGAPNSYALCDDMRLRAIEIRKAHFKHMKYKILFHIDGDTVVIDLVCHDLRNYVELL